MTVIINLISDIQMSVAPSRRVLPPGIEDDVVFGILWIRVTPVKTPKLSTQPLPILIQFWGQSEPAILNPTSSTPATQQYDVKCPVTFFHKYLEDMRKHFRIEIQELGTVSLDLTSRLKSSVSVTSKTPFDRFKGSFQVIGKGGRKVGSLQVEMCATFNPEIAIRQLGEEAEQAPPCPAKGKECQCSGVCKCKMDKINALDVLAVQKPELFREFYEEYKEKTTTPSKPIPPIIHDNRIPNSLNIKPTEAAFDANRYLEQDPVTPKAQQFPTVEKILTYSNLRLKKEESKETPQPRESSKPISIKQQLPVAQLQQEATPVSKLASINKLTPKAQRRQEKMELLKLDQKPQIKRIEQEEIIPVSQQMRREVSLSGVSEVQKLDESVSVEAQKQILSRVVNLNEQLERQRKHSPHKAPLKEATQQRYHQPLSKPTFSPLPPPVSLPAFDKPKKISTLLMNMVLEIPINTIQLPKQGRFTLSYRPYGQKESIKIGPMFQPTVVMMFPVGEPQIAKMNKIPFILQFWGAVDGELLGIIKLSLAKIYKGFILEGRLNELAIKTSILPTVIEKGYVPITTLIEKPVGQCYLSAHIGTTAQMQGYLNANKGEIAPPAPISIKEPKKEEQEKKPDKEASPKEVQKQIKRRQGNLQDLTSLLGLIDTSGTASVQTLIKFMSLNKATHKQFESLLQQLNFKGGDVFALWKADLFECRQLSFCFEDYKKVKEKVAATINLRFKQLSMSDIKKAIEEVKDKSSFGVIERQKIAQITNLNSLNIVETIGEITDAQLLIQWLQSQGKIPLKAIKLTDSLTLRSSLQTLFLETCKQPESKLQSLLTNPTTTSLTSVEHLKSTFLNDSNKPYSTWFWLWMIRIIHESFGEEEGDGKSINTAVLFNWITMKKRQTGQIEENEEESMLIEQKQEEKEQKKEEKRQEVKQEKQNKEEIKKIEEKSIDNKPKEEPKIQPPFLPTPQPVSTLTQHTFTISLQQLQLSDSPTGQCTISYRFPFEQDQITSRRLQILREKSKYKLTCIGTHKFTIAEPIQQYLGESTISIRVVVTGEGEMSGDLHSEQLLEGSGQYKVVPLFTLGREGIVGKIKLRVDYKIQKAEQSAVGRQTIRDVFLPKSGHLNFQLSTTVDSTRIRQQFGLKQDFYLLLSLDLFGQNPQLAPHYPPYSSKLTSDSLLSLTGSLKLTLTPQILQHLRSGSCICRLLLVHWSKQGGNYGRKQQLVASFKAPLISVIRQQGLLGDYAFKNKLGMFVSLANCKIKYEKHAKSSQNMQAGNTVVNGRDNYWIIIDFAEVINFEGELGWIRFETVQYQKRIPTEKVVIRDQGCFDIDNRCLTLQMSEQQFASCKLLPIRILTPSLKMGMDINIRPIAKMLTKQKYAITSHYFLVVDEHGKSRKMRIGAKIYAFRGQAALGNLVEAISKNPLHLSPQQDYSSLMETLRKHLKLSAKSLDQCLHLFLDRRKKDKLPLQFYTCTFLPSLDLTPIVTHNSNDAITLASELPSEIQLTQLLENIEHQQIRLLNLRNQFLERYSFSKLNEGRLDQNVEYLGLHNEIDLLVFVRKLRVEQQQASHTIANKPTHSQMRISILRGYNFHLLYNGIKPNAKVHIPELTLTTDSIPRNADPVFNEHLSLTTEPLKKLRVEVYHDAGEDSEEILIGEGTLNLSQSYNSETNSKVYRTVITSLMSNRMQAAVDIKVQISPATRQLDSEPEKEGEKSYSELEESIGDSRIEQAMERVKNVNNFKKNAAYFESSDED